MTEFSEQWLLRLAGVISGLNWLFFVLGSVAVAIEHPSPWPAIGLAAAYTIGFHLLPRSLLRLPIWREGAALLSTAFAVSATILSGGLESPLLLLAVTPILLAALMGGYRLGFATAALSSAVLIAFDLNEPDTGRWFTFIGLSLLVAATFGLARKVILEAMDRVEVLTQMTADTGARLEQLENANLLLNRFAELTRASDLSASELGKAALESIRSAVPFTGANVLMQTKSHLVSVAKAGEPEGTMTHLPVTAGGRTVAAIQLHTDRNLTDRQRSVISELLTPTGIAFANIRLLEDISQTAIADERKRIARELHDGIGPGLAALGLAMDVTAMENPGAIEDELHSLRTTVTGLVGQVRQAVTELREPAPSLNERVNAAISSATVDVRVSLKDDATLTGSRGEDIAAVVVEAIRNALNHAHATTVAIDGYASADQGSVTIADDGVGFDPHGVYDGHYGIVGMRERATKAAATLDIESTDRGGAKVRISWSSE